MSSKEAELAGSNFRSTVHDLLICLQAGCASELLSNCMNHFQHLICGIGMTVMEDQALQVIHWVASGRGT